MDDGLQQDEIAGFPSKSQVHHEITENKGCKALQKHLVQSPMSMRDKLILHHPLQGLRKMQIVEVNLQPTSQGMSVLSSAQP